MTACQRLLIRQRPLSCADQWRAGTCHVCILGQLVLRTCSRLDWSCLPCSADRAAIRGRQSHCAGAVRLPQVRAVNSVSGRDGYMFGSGVWLLLLRARCRVGREQPPRRSFVTPWACCNIRLRWQILAKCFAPCSRDVRDGIKVSFFLLNPQA